MTNRSTEGVVQQPRSLGLSSAVKLDLTGASEEELGKGREQGD